MQIHPLDYVELHQTVNRLNVRFPFLSVNSIGKSLLGREIPSLVVGKGSRHILLVGTHHGMEWITGHLLLHFLEELCYFYESKKNVYNLCLPVVWQQYTIHVIPVLNPDGVDYQINGVTQENPLFERLMKMNKGSTDFSRWQANARGVDLNHNYSAGFDEYKKLERENAILEGAPTRYSGHGPESEPEVKSLCNYIRFFKEKWKLIITFHTQGEEIYDTSGGVSLPRLRSVSKYLSRYSGYQISEPTGLASYGGLTDWCLQVEKIPCITIECGKGENPLPIGDFPGIYARLREMLFSIPKLV